MDKTEVVLAKIGSELNMAMCALEKGLYIAVYKHMQEIVKYIKSQQKDARDDTNR